jgi:hypothetical protein
LSYWLDYSAASLSGSVIKAAGYDGVIRYIDEPGRLGRKHTNPTEYRSDLAAGLAVRLVMEVSTGDANGGYARGVTYAQRALAGANYIGYHGVIYFCNDSPTLPSSTLWDDYLTGAASVLGWDRVGAYGFANAMDVASHMTDCKHFWQAGRRSDVRPFVQIWQDNNVQVPVGGITCDRNLILKSLDTQEVDVTVDELLDTKIQQEKVDENGAVVPDGDPVSIRTILQWTNNRTYAVLHALANPAPVQVEVDYAKLAEAVNANIAKAVADELDRRARDGDPATGPVS